MRRRKSNLKTFLKERGITNYVALEQVCSRLGVAVPTPEAFEAIMPSYVSDPTAGVVVVPPLDVVNESTGERENVDDTFEPVSTFASSGDFEPESPRKKRKKAVEA